MEGCRFARNFLEVRHGSKMNKPVSIRTDDLIFMLRIIATRQHPHEDDRSRIGALGQFGIWFGAQRRRRGLTLETLAGLTGLDTGFLAGIELGLEPGSRILSHAESLAAALGQPALAFINMLNNTLNRVVFHDPLENSR